MRKLLHFFGIHHWGEWSWPLTGKVKGLLETYDAVIQISTCSVCNQTRIKEVK